MRVAVYQRYLATLGGGERHALELARFFRDRGDSVDVLAPPGTTLDVASEHLGVDVEGLRLVTLDSREPCHDASRRSRGYDYFVNVSYGSTAINRARHGIYACHFPWRHEADELACAEAPDRGLAWVSPGQNVVADPARGWWTRGRGRFKVSCSGTNSWQLTLRIARSHHAWSGGAEKVDVLLDGGWVGRYRLPPLGVRTVRVRLPGLMAHAEHELELISGSRIEPISRLPLGVHVRSIALEAPGSAPAVLGTAPFSLRSYDLILAHSAYVSRWITTWWGLPSTVVHPSVTPVPRPAAIRDPADRRSIVVVGRFFTEGHSKCQADLVSSFRGLHDSGLDNWQMHLIGGVQGALGRRYLERVRGLAEGYPVQIHVDAPRPDLERRVGEAAIVWHASGWKHDQHHDPGYFEHFGIGIVEAMSAGAVPVVLGIGGPAEIVRHGVDGLQWTDGPEAGTRQLATDPELLRRMSASASRRAAEFRPDAFDARVSSALAALS